MSHCEKCDRHVPNTAPAYEYFSDCLTLQVCIFCKEEAEECGEAHLIGDAL